MERIKEFVKEQLPRDYYEKFAYCYKGGKRIRPLLVKKICERFGKDFDSIIDMVAAIELLHCSSLIHDDVIDKEISRRGEEPFYREFSIREAVLFGDFFATTSLEIFIKKNPELTRMFIETLKNMIQGQIMELKGIKDKEAYFDYIEKKTASLFLLSAQVPYLVFGLDMEILDFAKEFGMAFQIANDLMEKNKENHTILNFMTREETEKHLKERIKTIYSMNVIDVKELFINELEWVLKI